MDSRRQHGKMAIVDSTRYRFQRVCRQVEEAQLNINGLLDIEHKLNVDHGAKMNLLKYLQVEAVREYEKVADAHYFALRQDENFDELERIAHKRIGGTLEQPRQSGSVEDYLRDAEVAKSTLDELVEDAARDRAVTVFATSVKSSESTRRKAEVRGSIRRVTDMARISVVCDTIKDMVTFFELLEARIQVKMVPPLFCWMFPLSFVDLALFDARR